MAVKLEYKINSKVLFLKGLKINDRDVNAAVKCLIWLQGLLPLLMQTTILVFCLKSDLLPKPDNTKIQNIIQNTKPNIILTLQNVSVKGVAYITSTLRDECVLRSVL